MKIETIETNDGTKKWVEERKLDSKEGIKMKIIKEG
jgi:hypothetical protein